MAQLSGSEIYFAKKELRKELLTKRRELAPQYRDEASRRIVQRILAEAAYQEAKRIFTFMPMSEEVQVQYLFPEADAAGKELYFPICFAEGRMEAALPADRELMAPDKFGIPSPNPEKDLIIEPEELDLILVPMLSFDRDLHRIGYGGGFYDRYLGRANYQVPILGLCFAKMEMAEIPRGRFDRPLPVILTEKEKVLLCK